jgi:hypothetical protein
MATVSIGELPLRVDDVVALRPGAPVAGYPWLQPGLQGRVLFVEAWDERDVTGEVTVGFGRHPGQPLRLHGRWLQLVSRPRERETRGRR